MSEREVRKYAHHVKVRGCRATGMGQAWGLHCTCGLDNALSESPDVVVLLREIRMRVDAVEYKATLSLASQDRFRGMTDALDSLEDYIQEQFHVRLTADGWKWVEEGE